jgi:predicted Zn-dependent peptidase
MPSKHIDVALNVLSDMVKNPTFDEKELEKERKVIFEEIKMRKDNPRVYVLDKIQNFLYEDPFGSDLIGTQETMNSINWKKINEKFKKVYSSENMILSVVGDCSFEKVVDFVENNFGKERGNVPQFEIKLKNGEKIEKRKGIDQANLVFAYHVPMANDSLSYSALVLGTLLAGGMSSRLFQEIREKRNLAYSISGSSAIHKDFAYNSIYVGTTKESVQKVKELILTEFEKVSKELNEKELNEVKEQLIGNYQIEMEDSQSQMVNLLLYEVDGNAKDFYDFEKNILNVKLEEVKTLAKLKSYSFFALVPED